MKTEENTPAELLLPHREPARLIEVIEHCDGHSARAIALPAAGMMGVENGAFSESGLVECMAQTVAAMEEWNGIRQGAGVAMGMLCGVSDFVVDELPGPGRPVEVSVSEKRRLGPMLLADGEITCDGRIVAHGEVKIFAGTGKEAQQ